MSKRSSLHYCSINLWKTHKRQLSKTNISTHLLHLFWLLKYHLYFYFSSQGKAYLIDDQSRGNNKQSGYVQIHERTEKIVEGIVDEFCIILSSIKQTLQRRS